MTLNEVLQLNISSFFDYVKTIRYGYQDKNGVLHVPEDPDFRAHEYIFSSPQEVVENCCGWCWDVANLISAFCRANGIVHKCFFLEYKTEKAHHTHTQVMLEYMGQWYNAPDNSSKESFGEFGFSTGEACIRSFHGDYSGYLRRELGEDYDPGKLVVNEFCCEIPAGISDGEYLELVRKDEIMRLLKRFGIQSYEKVEFIDSSHGDFDIRQNYIIDKKYVLRVNSAKVMTEARVEQLNTLIQRYQDFGMESPLFLKTTDGIFVVEQNGQYCYLSEYLDYKVADAVKHRCRKDLIEERVIFVSRFAERFKNVNLIETVSMYSLFDLSPYDQLNGFGIDEKQDNLNHLTEDLNQAGEQELAAKLAEQNREIRNQLKAIYKQLPRCVFQGDENFSNLCVDENDHIVGLFDFNMSGTEVIANYLANIAFQGNFYYTDEIMEQHTAAEVFEMIMTSYRHSTGVIDQYYSFTEQERYAYRLYSKIVMISGYCNTAAFSEFLKEEKTRHKVIELLKLISEQDIWGMKR